MLVLVLLIVALVLVAVCSLGWNPARPHLGWLGVAVVILTLVIGAWPGH